MRRVLIGFLAALVISVSFILASPITAEAKTTTRGRISLSDKGGVAWQCKKRGEKLVSPQVMYICPGPGYFAFMRSGPNFRNFAGFYWKFYPTLAKAITASERSNYN